MRKLALFITAVCVLFSIKYNDGLRAEVFLIKDVIFLVILRYLIELEKVDPAAFLFHPGNRKLGVDANVKYIKRDFEFN